MAFKAKGLYAPEKREHGGAVAVTLAFTDEDRALARKGIDQGIRELMEINHGLLAEVPPQLPPALWRVQRRRLPLRC